LKFALLAKTFNKIESTSGTLAKIDLLVKLFRGTSSDLVDKIIYLMAGHPSWMDEPEIGIAEKSAIKAVAQVHGISVSKLEEKLGKLSGQPESITVDLGALVESLKKSTRQKTLFDEGPLTITEVYESLKSIARFSGSGSSAKKLRSLEALLRRASPAEGKWIIRMVEGKFRIGIADKAILDALAITYTGDKVNRNVIETAYNICTDLGLIARTLADEGLDGIKNIRIRVGVPIKMMLGQRLPTIEEILKKFGGACGCEFKYDGIRIQAHKKGEIITLFSRNLEKITKQFPDVSEQIKRLPHDQVIVEGECVAIDPETQKLRPFQELMHRRRKFDIDKAIKQYRVKLFLFDLLYLNGKSYLNEKYEDRRRVLEETIAGSEMGLAEQRIVDNVDDFENFLEESLNSGCEGLMAKALNSKYTAGARGWSWIKFKFSYQEQLTDTIDLVIVGALMGRGKRAGAYGSLFGAIYNPDTDQFEISCKIASGFTDMDLEQFKKTFSSLQLVNKDSRVIDSPTIKPDVWFEPKVVLEVKGDEITLSSKYPAARDVIRKGYGLSIRFPRLVTIREDKKPEDATTRDELIQLYETQRTLQGKAKN